MKRTVFLRLTPEAANFWREMAKSLGHLQTRGAGAGRDGNAARLLEIIAEIDDAEVVEYLRALFEQKRSNGNK
jgi:hypothetical protein